jgi:hypothetical protein
MRRSRLPGRSGINIESINKGLSLYNVLLEPCLKSLRPVCLLFL